MPLSLIRTGTSGIYGLADIGAEYFDKTPTGSFRGVRDWSRGVATIGGGVIAHFVKNEDVADVGEALELASIPLLEKSVVDFVLSMTGQTFRAAPRGQITVRRTPSASAPGNLPGTIY